MRKDGENMGKQQKYMPYPVFRISGFGKDQRYGKQRKTGESFGIYHAVGGVCHRLRKCVEIPVDVRAERWRKLHADLRDLPDRAGPARHDHGILRGARGADQPTLYVSEIIRWQGKMESVGHRLSHRKHCVDRFLCGGVRMDPLLFCKISDRAESGFRF